ncbi:hypothetical protein D3C73_643760 [compost metagenome]
MSLSMDFKAGLIDLLGSLDPTIPVYSEPDLQGLPKPAFVVLLLSSELKKELGRRYNQTLLFDLLYYPDPGSTDKQQECQVMADRLYEHMELVEVNGITYSSRGMKHQILEGVLHFTLTYQLHVTRTAPEAPIMKHIEQGGQIKHV